MNTKHLFVIGLLFFSLNLSAQQSSVAYASAKSIQKVSNPAHEKDVLIHRYVLDGKVDIDLHSGGKANFTLFNDEKVEIREYEMDFPKKTVHSINLNDLSTGTYYIRVKKDNQTYVRKILVE